ncbi:hypothetical protein MC7420_6322 [Coleofasciculus chthonoplastes PCC 7420]|uniref:Sulfotransferase domain superfamily n=1 Tax=Coleofasciculus chthonoplastes PCC 7420 TaxID=118168 RepID=B4VQC6_9CYAN|nr:hypothetical protein [Coleofasciculus chthonoplastes]EDX75667.1 hypothetical protein MC7420_6322 [Coleofasciculus chthonoplastes PCC 7420]
MPNIHVEKLNLKGQRLHIRFLKQQVIRGNLDVLVCSPGGVGSSFFIAFLEKYKSVNSYKDRDGLKHIDRPPLTLNSNLKAIYIYGEPFNAVLSLFRRKYHHYQSKKLLFKYPNIEPITKNCTLKKYLEEGIDRLKLGAHFENWNNSRVTYPIMLVKYESIWENLPEIFDYLEIPQSEIGNFPPPQNRNSDWNLLSEDLKDLFFNMYGDLQEKIMNFDDIKIIKPKLSAYIFLPKYALYIGALYKQKLIG